LNIEIGEGNVGAIALRLRGAQGSSAQDVTIYAGDGLTGIEGATGSGYYFFFLYLFLIIL